MQPKLTYNCPEKWEDMKVGLVERYCGQCNKHVHDFTSMSREEIYKFFQKHKNEQVCGRVLKSQVDYSHIEHIILVNAIKKSRNNKIAFYLLSAAALTIVGCGNTDNATGINQCDTVMDANGKKHHSPTCTNNHNEPDIEERHLLGDITLPDTSLVPDTLGDDYNPNPRDPNAPYQIVEEMPQFKGGESGLIAYIQNNIKYPDWEQEHNIQGTVYVMFIIERDGRVTNPKIIRRIDKSQNIDAEVLRIIAKMPRWKPGKQEGKTVRVQLAIPVKFTLSK